MKRLELTLAAGIDRAHEPFTIVAENRIPWPPEPGERSTCHAEGHMLADLLLESIPGGTVVAMIERLRHRYNEGQPFLNPFLDENREWAELAGGKADR